MSTAARNVEVVKNIYAAFGKGDVPAILERLSEEVEWEFGATDYGIPWLQPRRGRKGAAEFFESLRMLDIHSFQVLGVMGDGEWVVGLISIEFTVTSTGRKVKEQCEVHVWRFDDRGQIIAMKHGADTHQHFLAVKS